MHTAEKPFTAEDLAAKLHKKYRNISKYETLESYTNFLKKLNLPQKKLDEFAAILKIFPKVDLGAFYNRCKLINRKDNIFNEENLKIIKEKSKYFNIRKWSVDDAVDLLRTDYKYIHQVIEVDGLKGREGFLKAERHSRAFKNTDRAINLMPEGKLKNELQEINQKLKILEPTHWIQDNPILLGHIAFNDNINDPVLLKKIKRNLTDFKQAQWIPWEKVNSMSSNEQLYNKQLQEIMIIQDVVNSYKNIYNPIKRVYPSNEDLHIRNAYLHEEALEKLAKEHAKEQNISKDEALNKIHKRIGRGTSQFAKDAEQAIKNAPLQDYINIFGEKEPKIAQHLYNQYYLTQFPENIQVKCKQISQKFGTFVFLPTNFKKVDFDFMNQELSAWKKAGKKEAVMPKYIAFSPIEATFVRRKAKAFAVQGYNIIYFKSPKYLKYAKRHEMMHLNDRYNTGDIDDFEIFKNEKNKKLFKKKKFFREEFKNAEVPAGKKERLINYAFKSRFEYLAVAAEGNMKKYSEQFKQVLESLGMKRWIMKLPFIK